jgi:Flp pilus assembly protein TadG
LGFRGHDAPRGQSAVEFVLVFPIFLFLLFAMVEFAFAFTAQNSLSFAVRDVARVGVESGDRSGSDCTMLDTLESVLGRSARRDAIRQIDLYWSDARGNVIGGAVTTYRRTGSMTCTTVSGETLTLPYTAIATLYPETSRCTILAGCGGGHSSVDTLGVRVIYDYPWVTPLAGMLQLGSSVNLVADQQMRIEPVL